MFDVRTVDDLWNHIAYVRSYGPDRFPYEDFLTDEQQMDFDMAFRLLRKGVEVAYPEATFAAKKRHLYDLLAQSEVAYLSDEDVKAAHLLNAFEEAIFKT